MKNPYEDDRAERIAIVEALTLLEWVGYTTPPSRTRFTLRRMRRELALRLSLLVETGNSN